MRRFILCDVRLMLKGEADVVESFKEAVARDLVDAKLCGHAFSILDGATLQVDAELVCRNLLGSARDLRNLLLVQDNRQYSVLHAVVRENIGERGRNDGAEAMICQRPDGMFARRSATKIFPGNEDAGSRKSRVIE